MWAKDLFEEREKTSEFWDGACRPELENQTILDKIQTI